MSHIIEHEGIRELAGTKFWSDSEVLAKVLEYIKDEDLEGQVLRHLQVVADDEDNEDDALYKFEIAVYETRVYRRTYHVIAKNEDEARDKAEKGETEWESDGILDEVDNREVNEGVEICKIPLEYQANKS